MASNTNPVREVVTREWPPLGKYRVRLVEHPKTHEKSLDIREYVSGSSFEGYTRRGIRLNARAQIDLLRDALKEILESSLI